MADPLSLETYGRYQLLKKLATGGMAQIYLARQQGPEGFEKLLVVKRILPHLAENQDFVTMFLDEARIAARLNHPNIVTIFDLGAQDDSFFIAMEFIHGEDIRRVWKHADKIGTPIPLALICRMIIDASAGLDYAHKKVDQSGRALNIVHRDISPQNILVSFEGGVKVVDFGIAKAADQATVTKSGVLKGKYSYMSPEQAGGQPIDCRSDIFALGVVLYELLTGTRLFKRATDIQTLNAVSECKVAPPSEINPRVPPDLDAIVMKALAKDRKDRFSESRQLGAALESWLLANKMPSSSAMLAEFMHEIYAERLAREQEEGRLLIETAESAVGADSQELPREKATPSLDAVKRQTKSMRGVTGSQAGKRSTDETRAEFPGRSQSNSRKRVDIALDSPSKAGLPARPIPALGDVGNPHTEASMPTQSDGRGRGALFLVASVAVVATLVIGGFVMFRMPKTASFSIDSTPPGATITGPDGELCVTPCRLEDVEPGALWVTIEKTDFKAEKRALVLKAGVHELLATVVLEPLVAKEPTPTVIGSKDPIVEPPPRPVLIEEQFVSDPPGAMVTLGTDELGPAPIARQLEKGTTLEVKLELKNFQTVTQTFVVGEATDGVHKFVLKAAGKQVRPNNPKPPEVVKNNPPPAITTKGTVRFIVKPWATVECPQVHFKNDTPFADQQWPAGEYSCTFTNPEYAPQTKLVRVEPEKTVKVSVTMQ